MAQDDNSTLGAGTDSISISGASSAQHSTSGGYTPSSAGSQGMGSASQQSGGSPGGSSQISEKASAAFNDAKGQAADRLGQVRDKAGELKSTLADKLDQGAQALRQGSQGGGQQLASAGAAPAVSADQIQRLAVPAATAMEKTATLLRGGSGDLRGSIEDQVRTNPGRTLLIALGVGYALGKAIRR